MTSLLILLLGLAALLTGIFLLAGLGWTLVVGGALVMLSQFDIPRDREVTE